MTRTLHPCALGTMPCAMPERARTRCTVVITTRDLMRRERASIAADSLVPSEMKPVIIHGLDAGWFQAALTSPRVTGHLSKRTLFEVRDDFMDDHSFELFRLVLDARYAPQMADESLLTAPEWVRETYLPAVLFAASRAHDRHDAAVSECRRVARAARTRRARTGRAGARSCAVAQLLALGDRCALRSPTPTRRPTSVDFKSGSCRGRGKGCHDAFKRRSRNGRALFLPPDPSRLRPTREPGSRESGRAQAVRDLEPDHRRVPRG